MANILEDIINSEKELIFKETSLYQLNTQELPLDLELMLLIHGIILLNGVLTDTEFLLMM